MDDQENWYDARELEDDEQATHESYEDELIRALLEHNLAKSAPSIRDRHRHEDLLTLTERADSITNNGSRPTKRRKFKSNSGAADIPIFDQRSGQSNSGGGARAEAIIRGQIELDSLLEKLADLSDTSDLGQLGEKFAKFKEGKKKKKTVIWDTGGNPSKRPTESADEEHEADKDNGRLNAWWHPKPSKLFWFAWPILLLMLLNKYWPLIKTNRVS